MKFKVKNIIYVVWDYEHITKERIQSIDKDFYIIDDCYANDKNSFATLKEAKIYAKNQLNDYYYKINKYITDTDPKLDT